MGFLPEGVLGVEWSAQPGQKERDGKQSQARGGGACWERESRVGVLEKSTTGKRDWSLRNKPLIPNLSFPLSSFSLLRFIKTLPRMGSPLLPTAINAQWSLGFQILSSVQETLESTVNGFLGKLQEVLDHFRISSIWDKWCPQHLEILAMVQFNSVILERRTLRPSVVFFGYYKAHTIFHVLITKSIPLKEYIIC